MKLFHPLRAAALAATPLLAALPAAAQSQPATAVPGYAYGQKALAKATYTLADLAALKKTLLLGEDDERALRQSKAILADQTDAVLEVWNGLEPSCPASPS